MLEYELAYIHCGVPVRVFRAWHSQKEWVWLVEWWKQRNEALARAAKGE